MAADAVQALTWYRLAAERGEPRAQTRLGWMLWEGRGAAQDAIQAHMWSNLAASQLTGEEGERVARARDFIASKLAPDELAKAQELARNWQPKK